MSSGSGEKERHQSGGRSASKTPYPCPQCGTPLPPVASFCPSCGHQVVARCSTCGAALSPGAVFCSSCGTNVSRDTQTQATESVGEASTPSGGAPTPTQEEIWDPLRAKHVRGGTGWTWVVIGVVAAIALVWGLAQSSLAHLRQLLGMQKARNARPERVRRHSDTSGRVTMRYPRCGYEPGESR